MKNKKIIIAGGSGLMGEALTEHLLRRGYEILILTRHAQPDRGPVRFAQWDGKQLGDWA